MTIDKYLQRIEALKIRSERKFERYNRLCSKASSPGSALHTNEIKARTNHNWREDMVIEAADALEEFINANDLYYRYIRAIETLLERLPLSERWALEYVYIERLDKPPNRRRAGLCSFLGVRTNRECDEIIADAKKHLTEIIKAQGLPIEE